MRPMKRRRRMTVSAGQTWCRCGGAEGIRTPDLLIANETRYQLRHSPGCARTARGRSYHPGLWRSW